MNNEKVTSRDAGVVWEAYEDALKKQVDGFMLNRISGDADAEKHFVNGLEIIRQVRDRAIELVLQGPPVAMP
jgi:hypothetical protein